MPVNVTPFPVGGAVDEVGSRAWLSCVEASQRAIARLVDRTLSAQRRSRAARWEEGATKM
jgi:hypothetical protein